MAAAAGTGRRSGKATDAAAGGSRSALGLGTADVLDAARPTAEDARCCSPRRRRSGEAAEPERRGGGAAGWRDAAEQEEEEEEDRDRDRDQDPRARPPDVFVCPSAVHKSTEGPSASPSVKHKLSACDEREDARRRSLRKDEGGPLQRGDDCGVLSDSENEEPVTRRIRRVSAFVRRGRTSSGVAGGSQRSRSCTEAGDDRGRKSKGGSAPAAAPDTAGATHSFAAGILLSSENSRSASAPVGAPERRPARRAGPPPSNAAPERSVSPESNDSISEELNHFKPIVCSPCTPPKRLADGRLLEPAVVKSTPRNLTWRLHKPTSYEASPAVLQRWRQIELDRQSCKVDTKGTLTSPVKEMQEGGGPTPSNKRKLLFDHPAGDAQTLKVRVPAVRYGGDLTFCGNPDLELGDGVGALFGRRHSFSPYARKSGFQSCKLAPKDPLSPREEAGTSKRSGKTKQQDSAAPDPQVCEAVRRERRDRALALKLQRQFDRESGPRPAGPDNYFLRSWMASHGRRRRGLRRSRRISKRR
ncbi:signal peptidase complex subunit 2 isoform X1 [Syngnathoides biaculeatus]|uniref:signal peptidase complex subunit 2 isoform X1 n=1 Tax=Syngnathoides biaculeatus TaxID=300417 RepID=UPI002ADE5F0F|nr:signal peptidase complex subunit 2 isoform X1 [Syngnathoides biaculeatus]